MGPKINCLLILIWYMERYMVFKILIWCMSWYTFGICLVYGLLIFNLVYTIVYDQYMLGLQQMTRKMMVTENVWSDFTHTGICAVYKNRTGILTGKRLFSSYHRYVQYQRLQVMAIFDWYTSFIRLSVICIATFFFAVLDTSKHQSWNDILFFIST